MSDSDALDPAQHGYTVVSNYALYFWRPYLGNTAFALWELLLSFCYGERDIAYPSISRLARMLTNSDHSRAVVTGRRRAAKDGASPHTADSERAMCRCAGALDILCREGLVQVTRRGHGPTASYTFRVRKMLPLLRPDQVARLSPCLQRDHANWLERHGIHQARDEWQVRPNPPSMPCEALAAPGTTPGVAALTPEAGSTSPADRRTTSIAPPLTNNPTEQTLMNHWWQEALEELRLQLTRSAYETCLLGAKACSFRDGVLTVQAPGDLAREKLEHRLAPVIRRVLIAVSDAQVQEVCFLGKSHGEGGFSTPQHRNR